MRQRLLSCVHRHKNAEIGHVVSYLIPVMRKQRHTAYTNCPVEAALDVIGGKWKSIILFRLMEGTRRFNELRRLLPSVTQRTLTNQLRELERDGLVHRTVFAEIPPRVEYRLTPLGESLEPVLRELRSWAEQHMPPLVPDER